MNIEPSFKTAALAGVWAASWGILLDEWPDGLHPSTTHADLLNLTFFVLGFALPMYFLVMGRHQPFERGWWRHASERARHNAMAKRMLVWLLSAGVVGAIWSLSHSLLN
ncbi:MAG: hypothetical protein ACM32J_08935 [Rhizobacter sp.]